MNDKTVFFADPDHAMFSGGIYGFLRGHGVDANTVMVGGEYTPYIDINVPATMSTAERTIRIKVMPDSPEPVPEYTEAEYSATDSSGTGAF
jgi:hypothetical protein